MMTNAETKLEEVNSNLFNLMHQKQKMLNALTDHPPHQDDEGMLNIAYELQRILLEIRLFEIKRTKLEQEVKEEKLDAINEKITEVNRRAENAETGSIDRAVALYTLRELKNEKQLLLSEMPL